MLVFTCGVVVPSSIPDLRTETEEFVRAAILESFLLSLTSHTSHLIYCQIRIVWDKSRLHPTVAPTSSCAQLSTTGRPVFCT